MDHWDNNNNNNKFYFYSALHFINEVSERCKDRENAKEERQMEERQMEINKDGITQLLTDEGTLRRLQ